MNRGVSVRPNSPDVDADPAHNPELEAAAAGDAEVIVSGPADIHHLLTLGTWRGIRVVAPAVVLDELR